MIFSTLLWLFLAEWNVSDVNFGLDLFVQQLNNTNAPLSD